MEPEAALTRALYQPINSDLLAIHTRKLMLQLKLSVLAMQSTCIIRIRLAKLICMSSLNKIKNSISIEPLREI